MSLKSWTGFLPKNAMVMARRQKRAAGPQVQAENPPESPNSHSSDNSHDSLDSLKNPKASAPVQARVLVFLERQPSNDETALLSKMMSAIGLGTSDYCVEFADFPAASCPWTVAMGLSDKKLARLSALRPDALVLPGFSEIQRDLTQKKLAWEKLQAFQVRMKGGL